jgi:iron complex outermembrane receptor protein
MPLKFYLINNNQMFKKITLTMLMLSILPLSIWAQFSITGVVRNNANNESLPAAHITVNQTFRRVLSDKDGKFKIDNLKAGTYTLHFSFMGFEDKEVEIKLEKNENIFVNLSPTSILEDEVVITATRATKKSGTTFQNLDKQDIQKADIGQDIPYILSMTPSLVSTSDAGAGVGYTGMRIRGTDISRINVTVNGIPMNDPESQGVWWVNMPDLASSLNSIQIQRGVGTSTNGTASFGASINMQTQKLSMEPFAEISTSYGSFNTQRYRLSTSTGLIDNKWSVDARLSKMYSDGYIDRASSDLKSFYVSGAYYGKRSILRFNIFSGKEKTYQAWYGVPKDSLETNPTYNPYTYNNETDNYQQDNYQMIYSKEINSHWNINAALHYTKGRGYYESFKKNEKLSKYGLGPYYIGGDTITRSDLIRQKWLDNDFYGATASANYDNKKNLRVNIGAAFNQYSGDHFGKIVWAEYALMGKDYEYYRNNGLKNNFNFFTKVSYDITEAFSIYGDIQYQMIDYWMSGIHDDFKNLDGYHHFEFVNPKFGLSYALNDHNNIYASAAVAQKEPTRNDFRDADVGKTPKAEFLIDYEAGYEYTATKFKVQANFYFMDYTDQLIMTGKINNVGTPIMTNVDKSYRAGIELMAAAHITKWLNWSANATFSQNKIKNFTEYVDNWDTWGQEVTELGTTDIAFSPNVIIGNQFEFTPIKNFNIAINSKYVGEQYIDNTSSRERMLDAYFTTDLRFNYNIKNKYIKNIALNFSINNIFNSHYVSNAWVYQYKSGDGSYDGSYGDPYSNPSEKPGYYNMAGYFPQAGINFMAGLTLRF